MESHSIFHEDLAFARVKPERLGGEFTEQPLSSSDLGRLLTAGATMVQKKAGAHLSEFPQAGNGIVSIVSGWAARYANLRDGRYQTLDILLSGDCARLGAMNGLTHRIRAVSDLTYLVFRVDEPANADPTLSRLLADAFYDETRRLDRQIIRLGKLDGVEKVIHFVLEIEQRLNRRSMLRSNEIPLPLTQQQIGDLLGMTLVHVNRVLRQLRDENLLTIRRGEAVIHDRASLVAAVGSPRAIVPHHRSNVAREMINAAPD